ncbi:MAG: PilZ domain-containing protein [Planctomycetota bacterium]
MIDPPSPEIDLANAELLGELEQSTPESVRAARAYTRLEVRTRVVVQPANMSERRTLKVQGITGDISAGGCQLLVPIPLNVGDIYWLVFDRSVVDVSPVYGRCMRSRVIREDAFEAGFAFFSPIDLKVASKQSTGSDATLI